MILGAGEAGFKEPALESRPRAHCSVSLGDTDTHRCLDRKVTILQSRGLDTHAEHAHEGSSH